MLWIVCACFFDVPSFKKLRAEILSCLDSFSGPNVRFILLDDSAGTDAQVSELAEFADCHVITLPYNMGHQAALVYGLRRLGAGALPKQVAENDYVITMDSDGEDRPGDVRTMLAPHLNQASKLSLVSLASRTERKESLGFKISYFFFKGMFRLLTGQVIKNGNFVAFRGWLLKEVIHHPHFDQCYSSSFISLPLSIHPVPLPRGTRFFGRSKMSRGALLTHGLRMLMPFTEKIATRGIVVCAGMIVLSLCIGVYFLVSQAALLLVGVAFLCSFTFALLLVQFVLLFATFSQSKATILRR